MIQDIVDRPGTGRFRACFLPFRTSVNRYTRYCVYKEFMQTLKTLDVRSDKNKFRSPERWEKRKREKRRTHPYKCINIRHGKQEKCGIGEKRKMKKVRIFFEKTFNYLLKKKSRSCIIHLLSV